MPSPSSRHGDSGAQAEDAHVADGFTLPDLEASQDAPPAYGEQHDQVHFSQSGMQAGANVTEDGRVNININQKSSRIADLLAPTLRNELHRPGSEPSETAPLPPPYIPPGLGGEPGQPPPPPLNIVIQIVGSRGDVQPFVALGKILLQYGHRVRLATHAHFQSFVEDAGLEFFGIGGDPAELMAFMVKHPGLMPGFDAVKSGEVSKRRRGIQEILLGCWRSCIEAGNGLGPPPKHHPRDQPLEANDHFVYGGPEQKPFVADAIIANPPSFAHIHIAEKMGIPLHMMFTMPWSPTRSFPHPLANIQSTNTDPVMTNYMSYALVEMMTWQGLGDVINNFRSKALDLGPISLMWAPGLLTRLRVPHTYCWSPALIPKPNDWGGNVDISGFFFLNLASSFTPEPDLAAFLEAGPPPVYIGFGSIVVDDPDALTNIIFEAVRATGVRVLMSKGWGGLGADSMGIPEGVFMLGNVPHDWLFKHVSAVCHHGGAGTSAAGIQAGKPTIVVPFFGDQPFWGAMVKRAGAGPGPIPYKELTAEKLADAINYCMESGTQERAQELGSKIREERGDEEGGKSFHRHLAIDDLRCSVVPSRAAVWTVRRTQVRLSPFAAAVLVKAGHVQYSDLKLYRSKEYNTEDQPWDPISAVTCSLVADISTIALGIADFPREVFKGRPKHKAGGETPTSPPASQSSTANASTQSLNDPSESPSHTEIPGSPATGSSNAPANRPASTPTQTSSREPSVLSSGAPTSQTDTTRAESTASGPIAPSTHSDRSTQQSETRPNQQGESSGGLTVEDALGRAMMAGESVGKIATTGAKSPMNFCLGLARGFRNAPRLYNDKTVRPMEKVHDLPSGLKVASKEFGFGLYDGLTGLATQPLKGAEKEGAVGLVKGFGKGIGGLMLKPASGALAIPAYAMQGAHAQIRNIFARSVQNYIIASRIKQGDDDYSTAPEEEKKDVLVRWNKVKFDLSKWRTTKIKDQKEQESQEGAERMGRGGVVKPTAEPEQTTEPRTGFFRTFHMSLEERKALHARKEAWKKGHVQARHPASSSSQSPSSPGPALPPRRDSESRTLNSVEEDEEFERAIQASVAATSGGNVEEDARVEEAIRASVNNVRSSGRGLPGTTAAAAAKTNDAAAAQEKGSSAERRPASGTGGNDDLNATDEEYQKLVEQAIQQSLTMQAANVRPGREGDSEDDDDLRRVLEESKSSGKHGGSGDDVELKRAIEASTTQQQQKRELSAGNNDEDEQLRRAIEESVNEHQSHQQRDREAKTEEEIVMEFVKKQSLAEEEYRRQTSKGKMRAGEGGNGGDEDEDDNDLKRAMETSLSMGRGERGGGDDGGGSSGFGVEYTREGSSGVKPEGGKQEETNPETESEMMGQQSVRGAKEQGSQPGEQQGQQLGQ